MREQNPDIRLDKWLWAVRLFKTRTIATQACRNGKVQTKSENLKPSHQVRVGEVFTVRHKLLTQTVQVKALTAKRVSAQMAVNFMTDLTPVEAIEQYQTIRRFSFGQREKGSGRPTKRERRSIAKIRGRL